MISNSLATLAAADMVVLVFLSMFASVCVCVVFVWCLCVLVMDVQAFERLLGPCMDIMKRNIVNYDEQLAALFRSNTGIHDNDTA